MIVKALTYFCITYKTQKLCLCRTSRLFHTSIDDSITSISLSKLKQTLKQNNVLFNDGHVCIMADCPICNTYASNCKQPKVYVNKKTGFFMCDNCNCKGPWNILEKFFTTKTNLPNREDLEALKSMLVQKDELCDKWQNIQMNCENISVLSKDAFTAIRNALSLPNLQQEDLCTLNCMHDKVTSTLHFPLTAFNTHVTGYKSLSYLTGKSMTQQTIPLSNCCGAIVYRYNSNKSDGTAVLVPTVIDMLALISQKSANVIICLPYGLQNLPQELLPSLEDYKKLILWFGNDAHSWDIAKQFARKLNEKRCAFVRPTELQPAPHIASRAGYNLKNIIQQARPIWHESITTFHNLREDVLSELQNTDKVQGIKWKKFPSLNRILKGHRKGELTVLTGPTGCGKTTFMSEYSLDLAMQDVNTLWGSFEIRNVRLAKTMLQQMAGVPLEDNLENFDSYANAFEKLPIYFTVFHGQQSIQVVMDAVEHATYVHDIGHVIIDNVQFMMGTNAKLDRFSQQDDIIAAFRTFATKYNCHVTLVMHPRKERDDEELTISSIFGSAKASQEADNVLIIQDKRLSSARGKTYLQVVKNRYTGDLGIMLLEFDRASTSFSQKKKAKSESTVKVRNIGIKREEPILEKQIRVIKR